MKTSLPAMIAGLVFASAALVAAPFEGKVNFTLTSGRSQPQQLSYQMKGGKIRVDLPGQTMMGGMIIDPAAKKTTVIMTGQQMYMEMAMPDVVAQAAEAKPGEAKLEKTGEKEKILGYDAEKYIATFKNEKTELWLAEGIGTFMSPGAGNPMGGGPGGGGPGLQAWEKALAGKELFPLRVIGKDLRMEATAIQKQSLPDALFTPPAGFQKFDMGAMMPGGLPGFGK